VRSAREIGSIIETAIETVTEWSPELLPGLDLSVDLAYFSGKYPDDLLSYYDSHNEVVGFLASEDWYRTDAWGAVRPGSDDADILADLVRATKSRATTSHFRFHFHTNFRRLWTIFEKLGY